MTISNKLKNFNVAFGITYKSTSRISGSTKEENKRKLLLSIPVLGIICAIYQKKSANRQGEVGVNSKLARGILCGLVVGMPIVLALDIIASISTQIHQARKLR